MARRKRRNHSAKFKALVAIAALKRDKTLTELAQQFDVHPPHITDWKSQLMERSAQVFGDSTRRAAETDLTKLALHLLSSNSVIYSATYHPTKLRGEQLGL